MRLPPYFHMSKYSPAKGLGHTILYHINRLQVLG